jgi:hypothetical protein
MQKVRIRFAYKQGFRRIFFLMAILWLGFGAYVGWNDSDFWSELLKIGIAPLAILYGIGVICVWIVEGFARADQ